MVLIGILSAQFTARPICAYIVRQRFSERPENQWVGGTAIFVETLKIQEM